MTKKLSASPNIKIQPFRLRFQLEHTSTSSTMSDGDDSDVDDFRYVDASQSSEQQTSKPKATRKRVMSDKAKQKKKARFTSEQSHSEIADIYDEKRTKVGTKKNYKSRINVLKE